MIISLNPVRMKKRDAAVPRFFQSQNPILPRLLRVNPHPGKSGGLHIARMANSHYHRKTRPLKRTDVILLSRIQSFKDHTAAKLPVIPERGNGIFKILLVDISPRAELQRHAILLRRLLHRRHQVMALIRSIILGKRFQQHKNLLSVSGRRQIDESPLGADTNQKSFRFKDFQCLTQSIARNIQLSGKDDFHRKFFAVRIIAAHNAGAQILHQNIFFQVKTVFYH